MHLYWRIIEELKYLDEIWIIKDPSMLRRYKHWIRIHSESINLNAGQKIMELIYVPCSLN
jgi:hypothetical protein